ncbi:hypothetical protein Taro_010817 [Colocasia esculenta]|uniref:Uncharacterized protein n=1 Tax=Colocasia esculenta TaxID=4460 RepID=A0A843UAQ1_COLES|nr:hypothetical protein [Colocasia esculenta]
MCTPQLPSKSVAQDILMQNVIYEADSALIDEYEEHMRADVQIRVHVVSSAILSDVAILRELSHVDVDLHPDDHMPLERALPVLQLLPQYPLFLDPSPAAETTPFQSSSCLDHPIL